MALYLLMLTVIPCADGMEHQDEMQDVISVVENTSGPSSEHDHNSSDGCSPFCVCHCCHTHVFLPDYLNVAEVNPYRQTTTIGYEDNFSSSHLKSLFRPPQV